MAKTKAELQDELIGLRNANKRLTWALKERNEECKTVNERNVELAKSTTEINSKLERLQAAHVKLGDKWREEIKTSTEMTKQRDLRDATISELRSENRTLTSDNKQLVDDIRATESRNDHVESSLEIYKARLDVSLFMEQEKQRLIDKLLLKLENSMLETNTANTRLRNYKALIASKEERQ